jgi:hypothetical protein
MIHEDTLRSTERKHVELLYKEEVFSIIGAAIEVHKELGQDFLKPYIMKRSKSSFE